MNEVMKQGMVEVMKNLRQRCRDERVSKEMAFPDWKAVHSEWDTKISPEYHLTVKQFLELTKAQ